MTDAIQYWKPGDPITLQSVFGPCSRCGHEWHPSLKTIALAQPPPACALCRSPYWNRPPETPWANSPDDPKWAEQESARIARRTKLKAERAEARRRDRTDKLKKEIKRELKKELLAEGWKPEGTHGRATVQQAGDDARSDNHTTHDESANSKRDSGSAAEPTVTALPPPPIRTAPPIPREDSPSEQEQRRNALLRMAEGEMG